MIGLKIKKNVKRENFVEVEVNIWTWTNCTDPSSETILVCTKCAVRFKIKFIEPSRNHETHQSSQFNVNRLLKSLPVLLVSVRQRLAFMRFHFQSNIKNL